nr:hypothetical protein [Tanacetum cinerariifolium]
KSVDHIDGLDEILGDYANTREEITRKQMIVHVGNSSTVDDVFDLEMLFETEEVGPIRKFKEVEVDADNESEEESDTEENETNGIDSEDLDYDAKHDEVFDDDEHIVKDVPVSPWPGQRLTAVGVDANNEIYPVAYVIVKAESKGLIQAIASMFPSTECKYCVRHIHENMKSQFKGGVYKTCFKMHPEPLLLLNSTKR